MNITERYAVTLPGPPGAHRPPEVVVVHATGELTADGIPIYADDAGTFQVEIQGEVAKLLGAVSGPGHHTCLYATRLR
ncbi:DUF6296 family protein [Kitasatospora sp. NPDC057940]|uniref:DUF6296 family protein n=1 Tax=Kitasatospora sp. NPDC057940 TaxID=3346285 RepID=UPI0036DEF737